MIQEEVHNSAWQILIASSVLAVFGWASVQTILWIRKIVKENQRLKELRIEDRESDFHRIAIELKEKLQTLESKVEIKIRELSDKFSETNLYITKLQVKLEGFSDVITVIGKLREDVSLLRGQSQIKGRKVRDPDDFGNDS